MSLLRLFFTPFDLARYQKNKAVFRHVVLSAKIEELQAELEMCEKRVYRLTVYLKEETNEGVRS